MKKVKRVFTNYSIRAKFLFLCLFIFTSMTFIGMSSRSIRRKAWQVPDIIFSILNRELFVYVEHFLAGIGMVALYSSFMLALIIITSKVKYIKNRFKLLKLALPLNFERAVILISSGIYANHILRFEIQQALMREYFQTGQIVAGFMGIIFFVTISFNYFSLKEEN